MSWLKSEGYTHCFYLAGGGIMHLVDSANKYFECVPVVHEVTAVIASEYFNESSKNTGKAFALLTTGPGLTNAITGIAGSWLESREILVLAGQVKSSDLKTGVLRQNGIQEVDGLALVSSISKHNSRITQPIDKKDFISRIRKGSLGRKGPVVIEICIDATSAYVDFDNSECIEASNNKEVVSKESLTHFFEKIYTSKRTLFLFGAGVSRNTSEKLLNVFEKHKIPIALTWNGLDRVSSEYPYWAGRPNLYGMRWSNVIQQQADLLVAVGTRLGLQQTGYNFLDFLPLGEILHIDIDEFELNKPNPKSRTVIQISADIFLEQFTEFLENNEYLLNRDEWVNFIQEVKRELPLIEDCHQVARGFASPYILINSISQLADKKDRIVCCSSGGTFTAVHQSFLNKLGQIFISNKGLASMGYGLAGAIGTSIQNPKSRTILFEGDGGFAQNLQDLGTVKQRNLNIKIFVFNNQGYASIRSTQRSYFSGNYYGCDVDTGLGLPDWKLISKAYRLPYQVIDNNFLDNEAMNNFDSDEPCFFEVLIPPDFTYLPKVSSNIMPDGKMYTAAIHDMTPSVVDKVANKIYRYFNR